ncbi:MAG: TolC family protein [Acidobacteriaceae bacterium]|nr:TolC family protein [Acidobacteriaceae bacterium]
MTRAFLCLALAAFTVAAQQPAAQQPVSPQPAAQQPVSPQPAAQQPELPPELTLSQALNIALSNSINIRTALARLEQATGQYAENRAPLLPQLYVSAHQNYQTVNLIGLGIPIATETGKIGPFASMDARVFLSQELLNFSKIRAWKSYRSREQASRLLSDNAREVVALNVIAGYLDALRAKATRDTLAAETKLANDLYRITRDRVSQGVSAELDANRSMQQVNALEQQRQEAEQSYIAAKLNLANILQAHVTSAYEVSDPTAYGTGNAPDRDATLKTALATRSDYQSLEASVQAAELQVRSVKASRLPSLRLEFDDGQSGTTPSHNVNTYTLQGVIEFPIYTGGRTKGEIEEAQGALREARTALDENRSQIETDVLTAISGVEWALKEVETSSGNVKLSRQEVDLTVSRFTQGISDNTEVVNAQVRLSQADDANIRAQYALGLARADLARAMGAAEKTYRR